MLNTKLLIILSMLIPLTLEEREEIKT